ncbi:hypothetical protein CHS0354_000127 [Potamilus streckersoni]|uniref:Uncharacterized protein n=1 Tax=Potamilus streckersoni TaxID=2493646 RepID=A0AAE0VUC1_9BIVA|nr:hypothetical protein CHS0354_000127 [Potamilus streckersoni]
MPEFVSYIVGEEKDCEGRSGTYCNGYLKPYTEYKVKIFKCTEEGCTESEWSEPMKTDFDPTVAVTVPVVLVLLTASTIVVVIQLRRKRKM